MAPRRQLHPQPVWDAAAVLAAFAAAGVRSPAAALHSLYIRLLKHPAEEPGDAADAIFEFPRAAAVALRAGFVRSTSAVQSAARSADGTLKLLIRLQDGLQVEAVVMSYDTTHPLPAAPGGGERSSGGAGAGAGAGGGECSTSGGRRATLCLSSQVGCQMRCTFCATGTMGLKGNLTAGEIVEQLAHATATLLREGSVRNLVFMGMARARRGFLCLGRCSPRRRPPPPPTAARLAPATPTHLKHTQ